MFGTETTPDLFFSVASKSLNGGLLDQLHTFLSEHPDTNLVIIDTLQKVREADGDATIEVSGRDQPDKHFILTRNKETLCWDFKRERSPDYSEPPEPVIEGIGNFINEDNPTWEGMATELIEKLELDIKPNAR